MDQVQIIYKERKKESFKCNAKTEVALDYF